MKFIKLFFAIAIISLIAISCKETKKEELNEDSIEATDENAESSDENVESTVDAAESTEATGETEEAATSGDEPAEEGSEKAVEVVETTTSEVEEMAVEEGVIIEKLADTPVIYPGCEEGTHDEIRACSVKEFKKFLGTNFNKDISDGLDLGEGEHKIRALLKIDKTGKVHVTKIVASRVELENELIRIVGKLPQMTPATKNGSPVSVSFVVPMNFQIEGY
jgi:hypothetical protein